MCITWNALVCCVIDVYDEANVRDINEKAKNSVTRQPMTDISNPAIPIERPKVCL